MMHFSSFVTSNTLLWNRKKYTLLDFCRATTVQGEEKGSDLVDLHLDDDLFNAEAFGIQPQKWGRVLCGEYAREYQVKGACLYLTSLSISTEDGAYPELNGVACEVDKNSLVGKYSDLALPLPFSGNLRIAEGTAPSARYALFISLSTYYESVFDLTFEDGVLIVARDLSPFVQKLRDFHPTLTAYLKNNWLTDSERALLDCDFGLPSDPEIIDSFFNGGEEHIWNVKLARINDIEKRRNNIEKFIGTYYQHYQVVHQYAHTFKHLRYVGLPPRMANFLEELVSKEVSEKMVVLAFLNHMLQTGAKGQWGNILPAVFKRQFEEYKMPEGLMDEIQMNLKI